VFTLPRQPDAITPPTAAGLDAARPEASRSLAFWSAIDLDMLALRDRVESSPLLRDGLLESADLGSPLALAFN